MKNKLIFLFIALFLMSATAASQHINYAYDGAGNRVSRTQANSGPVSRALGGERSAATADEIGNLVYATPGDYVLDKSLPVGNIPYTFEVNPNGSSAFTIPLSLPQGQAGMTPELNIVYNSLAGEGILGYGMNLSCISSITRCGKRRFYDGVNEAISPLASGKEAFELDGMRLIKESGTSLLLKEVDDFSRIKVHHDALGDLYQYFEVRQKDGTKLFYGDYDGSRASQRNGDRSSNGRMAWYLAAQEDVHGNYIKYKYERDESSADIWLTSITYTLNRHRRFQHENRVEFVYQKYADAPEGCFFGYEVKRDKILKEIKVLTDGQVMRRYTFDYLKPTDIYSNQAPRLYTITEYGEGGLQALNPMRIEWGEPGQRIFSAEYAYSQESEFVKGDFNGDGCMDLLTIYDLSAGQASADWPRDYLAVYRYGNPNGFSNELTITTFANQYHPVKAVAGDFNGDGLDDLFFKSSAGYEYWQASLTQNNVPKFTKQTYKPAVTGSEVLSVLAMADVNGDGNDELLVNDAYFKLEYTGGTRYPLPAFNQSDTYMIGDVDGDGCQDIIVCSDMGRVKVCSPAKNAIILERSFGRDYMLGTNCVLLCGYFNNDRFLDFLMLEGYNETQPSNPQADIFYNTGDGKNFTSVLLINKFINCKYNHFRTGDFNGDGLTDVVCVGSDNILSSKEYNLGYLSGGDYVRFAYGPDFETVSSSFEQELYLSQEVAGTPGKDGVYSRDGKCYLYPSYFYPIAADFSGDGKCDLVNVCGFPAHPSDYSHPEWLTGSTSLKLLCVSHQGTSDVVTGIKNGDGTKREIDYRLTTTAVRDPKFYNGMYASWNKDIPTFNTVSTVRLGSLFNDSLMENYSYSYLQPVYAKKDVREFQGFQSINRQDSISGLKEKDYYLAHIYSGYPHYLLSFKEVAGGSFGLSRKEYSYQRVVTCRQANGFSCGFLYLQMQREFDNLKGIIEMIQNSYDSNGNLTTRTTTHRRYSSNDTFTSVETMEYALCPDVSSFPSRISSYERTDKKSGESIVDSKLFTYDSKGNKLTETEHGMTKRYGYDTDSGILTSETVTADGKERVYSYEYDDDRYIKKVTAPMGQVAQMVQDAFGNTLSETAPDGRKVTCQYDVFGRLVKSLSHEQVPTEYRYLWADDALAGTVAGLCRQQKYYDGVLIAETTTDCRGRTLLQSELQPGNKWRHLRSSYTGDGLLAKEETLYGSGSLTPLATVDYVYDDYRRLIQEKHRSADGTALDKQLYYTYNRNTETCRTVTDKEHTETFVYDAKWNLISHKDTTGTTLYTYDAAGRLTEVRSSGYPMTATYNAYGLCTSVSNVASGTTTYTYNGFDELATKKDANNNTTTYTYDLAGRLTKVADGDRILSYTYNNKGQLLSKGVAGHQSVYTYTPAGLLQKEVKTIKDNTFTKSYTYDGKGRLLTYTSPSGLVQKFAYDAAHNLVSIADNATGVKLWEAKSYNGQGLLSADVNGGNRQTAYAYDLMGQCTGISNSLASFSYQYNQGGLLTKRIEKFAGSGLTETFGYDAEGGLLSAALSGKTPVSVTYGNGRTIKAKSDIGDYMYNAVGAPLAQVAPVSSYSALSQEVAYYKNNLPRTVSQGGYSRSYEYDADNQRDYSALTVSSSTLPFSAGKRYYFDDFERNINTKDGSVSDLDYIFADGRWVALVRTAGGNKTCYGVMTDRQGSLMCLYTDEGVVQTFSYDAWGNRRNPLTGAALSDAELVSANRITTRGYTGHEHLDEMGLINMNARLYDPKLGLFISVDPQADSYPGTYPYAYCGGDPMNRIDPTGADWYQNNETYYYTWFQGNQTREGYTYIGERGSVLGEFEPIIDDLLTNVFLRESLYSEGFTFDIVPNDKGALLGSKERDWDFFSEFVNGTGPEFSVFLSDHPYTEEMKTAKDVRKGQQRIMNGESDIPGQITEWPGNWGVWDALTTFSMAKQFIGSYRYDAFTSRDGKYLNNVISDSKSMSSLLYHLYPSSKNPNRKQQKIMGTTYQFYIWQSKK